MGPVPVYAPVRVIRTQEKVKMNSPAAEIATDPVCKMELPVGEAAATLKFNRRTYYLLRRPANFLPLALPSHPGRAGWRV